jgi:hypothetical protein
VSITAESIRPKLGMHLEMKLEMQSTISNHAIAPWSSPVYNTVRVKPKSCPASIAIATLLLSQRNTHGKVCLPAREQRPHMRDVFILEALQCAPKYNCWLFRGQTKIQTVTRAPATSKGQLALISHTLACVLVCMVALANSSCLGLRARTSRASPYLVRDFSKPNILRF